tara:strand:+ start:186 stop:1793 length:1608 start_codon:yes stop_codon:yes gene_type:complete
MYSFSEDLQFYNVSFNEDFLKNPKNKVIHEDKKFVVDIERINNFLNSYKNIDVKEIIRSKKNEKLFLLKIPKFPKINKTKKSNNFSRNISECRNNIPDLSIPFFLKNIVSKDGKPKEFQKKGINWLLEAEGRLLADDMGLGKTFQSIYAATKYITSGKTGTVLILCPSPLVSNWSREIEQWCPNFTSTIISSTRREKDSVWDELWGYSHFVITNYEQLRELPKKIKKEGLNLVIADEAHKLRKNSSKISKSIKELKYKNFWGLSGTPIEKNELDAVNLLKIIDPNLSETELRNLSKLSLGSLIDNYILRRMKSSVLSELKDFEEKTHLIDLNVKQLSRYKSILKRSSSKNTNDSLSIFNKLRQVCDFDQESKSSSKIDFIMELLDKIKLRQEKAVIFSFWIEPLRILEEKIIKSFDKDSTQLFIGEIDKAKREQNLEKFKTNDHTFTLLCSGKLGGEGINLTEANHAIFFNQWWNPSNNDQARDRILRIGQDKDVFIHNLVSNNTIENRLQNLLKDKSQISKELIDQAIKEEALN